MYTLVGCDGFIGGLSNVGYAVRYIGRSQGKAFSTEIIIDHGVRAKGKLLKYGQYLSGGGYISDLLCYGFQKEAVA